MNTSPRIALGVFSAAVLATAPLADGLNPGSALVYPLHFDEDVVGSGEEWSIISITNTNLNPLSGSTNVHFEYVNLIEGPDDVFVDCTVTNRVENLTPGDTLSVLSFCHNPINEGLGYLVISAQNPGAFDEAWAFDHLIGSEIVFDDFKVFYTLNAIPFKSGQEAREATDVDGDGRLDFDDVEYEGVPDELYVDSFVAAVDSSLVLINLSGGPSHTAIVAFDIFNDNEFPLSATTDFFCWMQRCLAEADDEDEPCISPVFSEVFLQNNTPDDPRELDIDCDNDNDFETGWFRIRGLTSNSTAQSIADPALLGAITDGRLHVGGRRLWESTQKQLNGDFLDFGTVAGD